jgi:citrate synthase
MTTSETAHRLGVKPQTVYAYVSRGLLTRHPDPGGDRRRSRFDSAEVERIAQRARHTDRSGALEVVVDTELTLLDPDGHLAYRGRDVMELARYRSFESVAELLWGEDGDEDRRRTAAGARPAAGRRRAAAGGSIAWTAPAEALAAARAAQRALPAATRPADRIRVIVAVVAAIDPLRGDRRPGAVRAAGASAIAAMVDALPPLGEPREPTVAARLWSRLSPERPRPSQLRALNGALVLLADHELAASTLAARVAASTWADPYLVILAGLSALGGALHGAAAGQVEALLAPIDDPAKVPAALGELLRCGGPLPGFGHGVYRDRDPRADLLLELLQPAAGDRARLRAVHALLDAAGSRALAAPNVDLALGALTTTCGLIPGSAQAIFAVARSAGLIAHALEEYVHRLRFRPRAAYVGPMPPGPDRRRASNGSSSNSSWATSTT